MEDYRFSSFIVGVSVATIFWVATSTLIPGSYYDIVHQAKTECEKNLPRTEKCVIVAVPETKK